MGVRPLPNREEGGEVMATISEELLAAVELDVSNLKHRLDELLAQQLRGFGRVAKLDARLDTIVLDAHKDIAALDARLETQEQEMVTCRRAFDAAAEGRDALAARLDRLSVAMLLLQDRVTELERLVEAKGE